MHDDRMVDAFPSVMEIEAGGHFISCFFKKEDGKSIVFIHGFGASKATFLEAFSFTGFQRFTMLAPDLLGFGDSEKPSDFSYLLKDQARILTKAIDSLGLDRFSLVTHSMGGIIGIELAEMIPDRVDSFINAEGNITTEDCTVSGRVANMDAAQFAQRGCEELKRSMADESEKNHDIILKEYLKDFSRATPESLHRSSVSTVLESNSGHLLERFARLPMYKCYIYGDKNKEIYPAEAKLKKMLVPLYYVSGSDHSMMKENPREFYTLVLNEINQGLRINRGGGASACACMKVKLSEQERKSQRRFS